MDERANGTGEPLDSSDDLRHVRIESGELSLDYTATAQHAEDVADELRAGTPDVVVIVDDNVQDDHPLLPCARLWE